MRDARVDVEFSRYAGLVEPRGIQDGLITESVECARVHEGRRQSSQVNRSSGGGEIGDVTSVELSQVGPPAELILRRSPVGYLPPTALRHLSIVEHRRGEHLEGQRDLAAVAAEQGEGGG